MKIKTLVFSAFSILLLASNLSGQQFFQKSISFPGSFSWVSAIEVLANGQILMAGSAKPFGPDEDLAVALFSKDYNLLWSKTYSTPNADFVNDILETNDGNIFIAFEQTSLQTFQTITCGLLKIAPTGEVIWGKSLGGDNSRISKIAQRQGGYLLSGASTSGNEPSGSCLMVNGNGEIGWRMDLGKASELVDIWQDGQGFIYQVGVNYSPPPGQSALFTKTSPSGQNLISKNLDIPGLESLLFISPAVNNHFLLVGNTFLNSKVNLWGVLVDEAGTVKWSKVWEHFSENIFAKDLLKMKDGNYLIGLNNDKLLKINDMGDVLELLEIPGGGDFNFGELKLTIAEDGSYLAGSGRLEASGEAKFWFLNMNDNLQIPGCCFPEFEVSGGSVSPVVTNAVFNPNPDPLSQNIFFQTETQLPEVKSLCEVINLNFSVSNDTICPGECIEILFPSPTPGIDYSWVFQNGSPATSDDTKPTGKICFSGEGTITLNAQNGLCSEQNSMKIKFKSLADGFPNAFTPNGDNNNDKFKPLIDGCPVERYTLQIISRWGELVFETYNPAEGWDGITLNGSVAPSDVYVWVAEFTVTTNGTKETRKEYGELTLIR